MIKFNQILLAFIVIAISMNYGIVSPAANSNNIISLPSNSTDRDLQEFINNTDIPTTIIISSDITFSSTVVISTESDILIQSSGDDVKCTLSQSNGRHFRVSGNLSLKNIILNGSTEENAPGGGIHVDGGNLTMENGAVVQGCSATSGGGIYVTGSGRVNMQGGIIKGNRASANGGGIYLENNCSLTLENSKINENICEGSGGGVYAGGTNSFVNMISGSISNNNISSKGNTSYYGGGLYVLGTFILRDGLISKNTLENSNSPSGLRGAGVYANNLEMYGGEISYNLLKGNATSSQSGGGVFISNSMLMESGDISYNEIQAVSNGRYASGAGIYGGKITITGGAVHHNNVGIALSGSRGGGIAVFRTDWLKISGGKIYKNNATWGGGIFFDAYVGNGNSMINGDTFIYENTATYGAGICFYNNFVSVTMEPEISGNARICNNDSGGYGGGILYYAYLAANNYSTKLINAKIFGNAEISGNTALIGGGGIQIQDSVSSGNNTPTNVLGKLTISGDALIKNNKAQYGGGIMSSNCSLEICDRTIISENQVSLYDGSKTSYGGGIAYLPGNYSTIQLTGNVRMSGNLATADDACHGGAIAIPYRNLDQLSVGKDVVFENNQAAHAYGILPGDTDDIELHNNNILSSLFSRGLQYGYNNNDITYTKGKLLGYFDVDFNTNGGSDVQAYTDVLESTKINTPLPPVRHGYTFAGWYSDDGSFTDQWDFNSDTVTADTTLYAKWNINTYTVTFVSNGGSSVDNQTIPYGEKLTEPSVPSKEGYAFAGWYSDDGNFTDQWDFNSDTVTGNTILYAKWQKIPLPSKPPQKPDNPDTRDDSIPLYIMVFLIVSVPAIFLSIKMKKKI